MVDTPMPLMPTKITIIRDPVKRFFAYARERHRIYLCRQGKNVGPWTQDWILRNHRFCNIYRELDATTKWFRENARDRYRDDSAVVPITVVFRWFNRISTGAAIFQQLDIHEHSAWQRFVGSRYRVAVLRRAILAAIGEDGPFVTAAYRINTRSAPSDAHKLDRVLYLIDVWMHTHEDWKTRKWTSLEDFCQWCRSSCLAEFMTYEIACDLRYTSVLEGATDIDTWANAGPGAVRGLNRILYRPVEQHIQNDQALSEMRKLLLISRQNQYWPSAWPPWELREVEHTLCEFDKYMRTALGEGRPRGSAPR